MPIDIHGKQYITVAERVQEAHKSVKDGLSIETELVETTDEYVLFKAKVTVAEDVYTGYATSTFSKGGMEAKSPVEVAETSAVGRALGFAGFGIVEGIATADEVKEAQDREVTEPKSEAFKQLYSLVVQAKNPTELNGIMANDKYKTLVVPEKQELQQRISKAVLRLRPND